MPDPTPRAPTPPSPGSRRRAGSRLAPAAALLLGLGACGILDGDGPRGPVRVPLDRMLETPVEVRLSPAGRTPLAAEATFRTRAPVRVDVEVLGGEPMRHRFPDASTAHDLPILGLHAGTENRVVLTMTAASGDYAVDTVRVVTEALPDFLPGVRVLTADTARMEPGWTLSSLSVATGGDWDSYPIIFDSTGEIRWYLDLSSFGSLVYLEERLRNGDLLFGIGETIYEWDMLGREVGHWSMPGYLFHHDVIEKPDGNLIVAVDRVGRGTVEDEVVELDRTTGEVVRAWDLRQVLDVSRRAYPPATDVDWAHVNAVWYDPADGGLVVSCRNQSAVVKLSRDGELVWIFGAHRGWGRAGVAGDGPVTADFLLTAVDATGTPYPDAVQRGDEAAPDFDWSWGQHAAMLLPDGHLFLFDNGLDRAFSPDGPTYSRGVEYRVDEDARTVRQVWAYGQARGGSFYSSILSDVDFLPETHDRLVSPGIVFGVQPRARVTEVTYPAADVVFDAEIDLRDALASGRSVWGEFDMVYRSERLPLYPEE